MRLTFSSSFVLLALSLVAPGCATSEPFCSAVVDATGRQVPACGGPRDEPICDLPGMEGQFEDGMLGVRLVGALRASCDIDGEIICPMGTTGEAYCITDPEL